MSVASEEVKTEVTASNGSSKPQANGSAAPTAQTVQYVIVNSAAGAEDAVELPIDDTGNLPISVLQLQFPGAGGLKYKNPSSGLFRMMIPKDLDGVQTLTTPPEGWSATVEYIACVAAPKRSAAAEVLAGPHAKYQALMSEAHARPAQPLRPDYSSDIYDGGPGALKVIPQLRGGYQQHVESNPNAMLGNQYGTSTGLQRPQSYNAFHPGRGSYGAAGYSTGGLMGLIVFRLGNQYGTSTGLQRPQSYNAFHPGRGSYGGAAAGYSTGGLMGLIVFRLGNQYGTSTGLQRPQSYNAFHPGRGSYGGAAAGYSTGGLMGLIVFRLGNQYGTSTGLQRPQSYNAFHPGRGSYGGAAAGYSTGIMGLNTSWSSSGRGGGGGYSQQGGGLAMRGGGFAPRSRGRGTQGRGGSTGAAPVRGGTSINSDGLGARRSSSDAVDFRTYPLFCNACNVELNAQGQAASHFTGKKHLEVVASGGVVKYQPNRRKKTAAPEADQPDGQYFS